MPLQVSSAREAGSTSVRTAFIGPLTPMDCAHMLVSRAGSLELGSTLLALKRTYIALAHVPRLPVHLEIALRDADEFAALLGTL